MSRMVLFHLHLFKNAGTSVDALLQRNFGDRWLTKEFESSSPERHRREVADWITSQPEARAFSSHTVELPLPKIEGVTIFPILFVRHPIDRLASVYSFERQQQLDEGFGAVLARNTTMAGYLRVRLALPQDRQCRNFHVERLAKKCPDQPGTELDRALAAVERLPFVGLVERFDASMGLLKDLIEPEFPHFEVSAVRENVSRDASIPLEQRLADMAADIGQATYDQVCAANADDLLLYEQLSHLI